MKRSLIRQTIMHVIKKNKYVTVALVFLVVAVVALSLFPPLLLKVIIDYNLLPENLDYLFARAMIYFLLILMISFCEFAKNGLLTIIGQKVATKLRLELNKKIMRLPSSYFSSHSSGEITSRMMNDVSSVDSLFADGAISMIIDCFKIIGIVVSIFIFSIQFGLFVLFLIPIIYAITRAFQKRMLSAQVENLKQYGLVNGHITETLNSVKTIKSYSKELYMEDLYQHRIEENFKTINRVNYLDSIYSPIIQITRAVIISLIVIVASSQINMIGISAGMVAACIEFVSNLFGPIEALGMELQNIQKGISGAKRVNDFYMEQVECGKLETLKAQEILQSASDICLTFRDVTFAYEEGNPILEHLNVVVKTGSMVTFMGRTGVGKTTLFRLIMGLLKPTRGSILLGETEVSDIPNSQKRLIFGYVQQQFQMIEGTIGDQISLKDETITREQMEESLRFVGLLDYVNEMEQGMDTLISPSTSFSQGQKQLLSIARAIVLNPPILLLDEITASLDSATEAHIVNVLQKARAGRTVLSISHRSSSILECDQLIQLE